MDMSTSQIEAIASTWLESFGRVLEAKDVEGVVEHFLPYGWLRDALVFSWDYHSLAGRGKIESYLRENDALSKTAVGDVALDTREHLTPEEFPAGPGLNGIRFAFLFETPSTFCRGYAALLPEANGEGKQSWRAFYVYVMVDNIKGHKESDHESGIYEGHTRSWTDVKAERVAAIERAPNTIIIGAGQCGLMVGARLRAMGIPAIIIEKMPRVGDSWRSRYPTLTLHSPRAHHQFLYAPFPKNWPTFTPRDKLANWMEQYVDTQDLVVWTSSTVLPTPSYSDITGRWTITVNRNGSHVVLDPANIIVATGVLGEPMVPEIPSASLFQGMTMHSSNYMGGKTFAGKEILVVGSGNSAADICQDLVIQGAATVTMLQRSSTFAISSETFAGFLDTVYKEGVESDVNDLKFGAMPLGLLKQVLCTEPMRQSREVPDRQMRDALIKSGLKLNEGFDGSGVFVYERLGGYFIDVGVSKMIIDGRVQVKSGVEMSEFGETTVKFTDGSEQRVDVVIFATSFKNIKPSIEKIFGGETIGKTKTVWGLDEEGEIRGCYRPSGHPGLWFAVGDFYNARVQSKQLALHLKSKQLGISEDASIGLASSILPEA